MKFIALYRVSTQRQNVSHLGLENQKASVLSYITSISGELIEEFVEVESGGNKDRISVDSHLSLESLLSKRPVLFSAIRKAQETGAVICVKEASRLSRFSLLIDYLLTCNIQFICADSPRDTPFIIKLKTSLNEEELIKVSERTRNALSALRERGYKWVPKQNNFTADVLKKATARKKELALNNPNNKRAMGYILQLRSVAGMTLQGIANKLNVEGFKTSRGRAFTAKAVQLLYLRSKTVVGK